MRFTERAWQTSRSIHLTASHIFTKVNRVKSKAALVGVAEYPFATALQWEPYSFMPLHVTLRDH